MTVPRHKLILWGSLVASVCIHLFLLLPAMLAVAEADSNLTDFEHELEEHVQEQQDIPEQERLGLDDSDTSSMTWVGYDTYQEHLAQLAEFDQAQFNEASSPENSTPNQEQATPADSPGTPANAGGKPAQESKPNTSESGGGSGPIDGLGEDGGGIPTSGRAGPLADADTGKAQERGEKPAEQPGKDQPEPAKPAEESGPQKPGDQPSSGGGAPATPPSDAPDPPQPDAADKSSDATSTISVPREKWISGHPVASQGLELFPRKPKFTTLQTLAGARNMVVIIRIGKKGRPDTADILQSSGNSGIDAAVLASLYRWRAKGTRLDAIDDKQTLDITLELIMSPRRN